MTMTDRMRTGRRRTSPPGQLVNRPSGATAPDAVARYAFGRNWRSYLKHINEERIEAAMASLLQAMPAPAPPDLAGLRFLDLGCGSGLFSLAARRLGARAVSIDYDPDSVSCALELRRVFRPDDDDADWVVRQGSALDVGLMSALGEFDVVYCCGVLHHTGDLWLGLGNATIPVRSGGILYVSLYNDAGLSSAVWRRIKRLYNAGLPGRILVLSTMVPWRVGLTALGSLYRRRNLFQIRNRDGWRGMRWWHDLLDWLGGYPYEVCREDQVFRFCRDRGFHLYHMQSAQLGNNYFGFVKGQDVACCVAAPVQRS